MDEQFLLSFLFAGSWLQLILFLIDSRKDLFSTLRKKLNVLSVKFMIFRQHLNFQRYFFYVQTENSVTRFNKNMPLLQILKSLTNYRWVSAVFVKMGNIEQIIWLGHPFRTFLCSTIQFNLRIFAVKWPMAMLLAIATADKFIPSAVVRLEDK